jgi:tight adherence protein B
MSGPQFLEMAVGASAGLGLILLLWLLWVWIGAQRRARRIAHRLESLSDYRTNSPPQSRPSLATGQTGMHEHRWAAFAARFFGAHGMNYAGQRFSRPHMLAIAALVAAAASVTLAQVFHFGPAAAIACGLTVWPVSFVILIGIERRRRERLLVASFPEAIDMIVRMVRAGMAVSTAIRTAGADLSPPLGPVFRVIAEEFAIGVPLDQVMGAMAQRIRVPEFRFFAVAVSLQHATGGSLTTTLENMADMMRRRRAMQLKAKAMVAEVRMTAAVLSFLPVVVLLLLLVVSPDYISALFFDQRGNVVLCAGALCVLTGAGSMRWMMHRNLRL